MAQFEQMPSPSEQQLISELGGLREATPPASLASGVLLRVGLADAYWQIETSIGDVFIAYNDRGISAVLPVEEPDRFADAFRARFGRPVYAASAPPERLARAVEHRLHGEAGGKLTFDLRGLSDFEQTVLQKTYEIPRGEVRPYSWVAREIGRPGASRAVGTTLAHNPVPLLIPCHRVILADGTIGNYLFGSAAKRTLLTEEGAVPGELEQLAQSGVHYFGSDTTHIFCYPTCRHARRTSDRHLVTFPSIAAAAAAGYRPCKVCRPAV